MTDRGSGRPVRFFILLMVGWTATRVVSTTGWPSAASEEVDLAGLPPRKALPIATPAVARPAPSAAQAPRPAASVPWARHAPSAPQYRLAMAHPSIDGRRETGSPVDLSAFISNADAFSGPRNGGGAPGEGRVSLIPPPGPLFDQQGRHAPSDRWHLGSWALWRAGGGQARASTDGRLGGSQIGARLDFDFTPAAPGRVASYARVSAAMSRPASPEAAVGFFYQPARRIPLTIAVERRIALGPGGRNANALFAAGGFGPKPIGPSLAAEAYVQTGIVGFRAKDGFIDGKVALLTPLRHTAIHVGISISGGAQPDVSRVDIGPEIQFRLSLPSASARLSIEWRERVIGNAAPPSGPAITLATDF
ncbi:hypothetical protein WG907_10660 [Sphingobium sp. AN558]|uniref:hypothetical protein n=1 Tax=Sphingobium sp. AN558 TaxID=3133442 RepID=UPI0030C34E74